MRFHSLKPDEPKSQKVTATSVEHYNFTLILKDLVGKATSSIHLIIYSSISDRFIDPRGEIQYLKGKTVSHSSQQLLVSE